LEGDTHAPAALAGWDTCKDTILEDACASTLQRLITNPDYKKLGPAGDIVQKMKTSAKALNNDGAGFVFSPELMKQVAVKSGVGGISSRMFGAPNQTSSAKSLPPTLKLAVRLQQ